MITRSCIGLVVALLLLGGCKGTDDAFTQEGMATTPAIGEYEVFYPTPYVSPPNLTFPDVQVKILEQRANGFKFRLDQWNSMMPGVRWKAVGKKAA